MYTLMGWPSFAPFQPAKTSAIACRIVASGASTLVPAQQRKKLAIWRDDRARRQRRDRQIFQPGHDGQPHRQAVAHHGTDGAARCAAHRTDGRQQAVDSALDAADHAPHHRLTAL